MKRKGEGGGGKGERGGHCSLAACSSEVRGFKITEGANEEAHRCFLSSYSGLTPHPPPILHGRGSQRDAVHLG
jgi:hypothetical protein